MSKARNATQILAITTLAMVVMACGSARTSGEQGARVVPFDESLATLTATERDELQRNMELPSGYDAETAAARDAFLTWADRQARDVHQRAVEIPRMEDLPPHEWLTYGYTPRADADDR